MRYEWTPPEALYAGQPTCFVEGPLEGLVLTRHEASVQQLAYETLRLAEENRALKAEAKGYGVTLRRYASDTVEQATRIAALEAEVERLRGVNRELAATCTHPGMIATQEGLLDV